MGGFIDLWRSPLVVEWIRISAIYSHDLGFLGA